MKIGLKFGASLEETRTETSQRTYTVGNDILGAVVIPILYWGEGGRQEGEVTR